MAKSITLLSIMLLMGYMVITRNEPAEGDRAIKNKLIKENEKNKIFSFPLISKDGVIIPFNFTCDGNVQYRVDMMNFARETAMLHLSTEKDFFEITFPNLIKKEYPLTKIIKEK